METGDTKLLVIDSEVVFRSLLINVLEEEHQVDFCDNCLMGLQILSEGFIPDLIISEYQSPKLNGVQFLREIRNSGFFKDLPVIIQTSADLSSVIQECGDHSADLVVAKPYDPLQLKAKVNQIILGRRMHASDPVMNEQSN